MSDEPPDPLDQVIADWLLAKEGDPDLLPGAFAEGLPPELVEPFLAEVEALGELDVYTSHARAADLPLRIGGFRVLGELGRGAFGAVYEAEQVEPRRRVALKVLHAEVASDRRAVARFRREAATAASLDHDNIVPVLDCGETADWIWLAMDHVRGRSLDRLLAARTRPGDGDHAAARRVFDDLRRFAAAFAGAVDALEFAHQRDVVHRDLKPANLMVREDGVVVVLDFGLASMREEGESALTRTGDFLGTPLYMAPEQAVGAENGTALSDVYSLGAVLYECITGRPPFERASLALVIDAIMNREPPLPRTVDATVPQELSRIVMQCLEKEPGRRYASAAALAEDLRRFANGTPVVARSVSWSSRLGRRMRRRPWMAGLVVAVALLAPLSLLAWQQHRAGQQEILRLERDRDLDRLPALLAGAPEHITVFGGASLRHYARFGLAQPRSEAAGARSPQAVQALALAADLRRRFPGDAAVLRAHAEILLDVGDAPDEVDRTLQQLLDSGAATPGDRAMAAVWHRRQGRHQRAEELRAEIDGDGPLVQYWLGFWFQSAQQYEQAIERFSSALASRSLADEHRYFALLHRGWCYSCPEIARLREAQDDLLQAGALRPSYGTARLLWAALHCLEEQPDLERAVGEVSAVLENAQPWLHVLTARVLQALAEAGTWQSGPVHFGAEFSPIAPMPLPPARAAALAGLSMQLLDGLPAPARDTFDVVYHRITGLSLTGRHDEALALAERRLEAAPAEERAPLMLQCARVHLAAGRAQRAHAATERVLAQSPDYVAAWRFGAALAEHLGDRERELRCVSEAVRLLKQREPQLSVFPDATALLPQLELRRLELLRDGGEVVDASAVAERELGGVLHGARGARARVGVAAVFGRDAGGEALRESALGRLYLSGVDGASGPALAHAARRGWLPSDVTLPAHPALLPLSERAGRRQPETIEGSPLSRLLAGAAARAAADREAAASLLQLATERLRVDQDNTEARLLRAVVLLATQRDGEAHGFLQETAARFPADLRSRFVEACAAASRDDRAGVQAALEVDGRTMPRSALEAAAAVAPLPGAATPSRLLEMLR
ncbi:MAG: protein kinase domain-containing protein [Planctomycetota bacterium]